MDRLFAPPVLPPSPPTSPEEGVSEIQKLVYFCKSSVGLNLVLSESQLLRQPSPQNSDCRTAYNSGNASERYSCVEGNNSDCISTESESAVMKLLKDCSDEDSFHEGDSGDEVDDQSYRFEVKSDSSSLTRRYPQNDVYCRKNETYHTLPRSPRGYRSKPYPDIREFTNATVSSRSRISETRRSSSLVSQKLFSPSASAPIYLPDQAIFSISAPRTDSSVTKQNYSSPGASHPYAFSNIFPVYSATHPFLTPPHPSSTHLRACKLSPPVLTPPNSSGVSTLPACTTSPPLLPPPHTSPRNLPTPARTNSRPVPPPLPIIRMRTSFSYSQLETLERAFKEHSYISQSYAECLAGQFQLPVECVTSWYSNKRDLERRREERRAKRARARHRG